MHVRTLISLSCAGRYTIMLDINFIQKHRDVVEKAIADKKGGDIDLDRILELYEERKKLRGKVGEINEARNKAAQERNIEAGRELKEQLRIAEKNLKEAEKEYVELMIKIPNVPSADTPVGPDESGNKVLRKWGEPTDFSFEPKPHWELGETLDVIDTETAANVVGARFSYMKGEAVLLQFSLIQFALSVLTDEEKLKEIAEQFGIDGVDVTAFRPIVPPVMVKPEVFNAMGRLEPRDDKFYIESDDLFLVGSAEHTMGPMFMNHVFEEGDLPLRYVGYSTAFRREAGSYGKDTRGILRQHQFDKMELETFVLPENSYKEQDFIVAVQEYLMQQLKLPYQVVAICTGDMGKPDHRQIDIETWMPGQERDDGGKGLYRETHSSDLIGGFQPRRLNTRVKRADGTIEHVHMNDATVFAIGRTLISILENYQQEDGSVAIPKVLQPYIAKEKIEAP